MLTGGGGCAAVGVSAVVGVDGGGDEVGHWIGSDEAGREAAVAVPAQGVSGSSAWAS